MVEIDSSGWAPVHYAAQRGLVEPLAKIVGDNKQILELRTNDTKSTALLIAAATGKQDTVKKLIDLGARVDAIDTKNYGLVEICALERYVDILAYLVQLDHDKLPVWKKLGKLLKSDFDKEADAAAWCLEILTRSGENHTSTMMETSPEDINEEDPMHEDEETFLETNSSDQVGCSDNISD